MVECVILARDKQHCESMWRYVVHTVVSSRQQWLRYLRMNLEIHVSQNIVSVVVCTAKTYRT